MGVLVIAGTFALISALAGDFLGAIIGLLVAGAGAIELHGETLLLHGEVRGMNWLLGSQFTLLVCILSYCALRLVHVSLPPVPAEVAPVLESTAQQLGMTVEAYMLFVYRLVFRLVAGLTVLYQGGMMLYYWRRRRAVARALDEIL